MDLNRSSPLVGRLEISVTAIEGVALKAPVVAAVSAAFQLDVGALQRTAHKLEQPTPHEPRIPEDDYIKLVIRSLARFRALDHGPLGQSVHGTESREALVTVIAGRKRSIENGRWLRSILSAVLPSA